MKLKPKNVTVEIINGEEDYTLRYLMNSPVLIYGSNHSPKVKNYKGVGFKNFEMMREIANHMLKFAAILEAKGKLDENL